MNQNQPEPTRTHHQVRTADGLTLAATRTGTGSAVTVVFVHGLLADAEFWSATIDHAAPHTGDWATYLAYDARGHGNSDWPAPNTTSSFAALADDLARVIDTAPGRVVVAAHSIGCFVALEYATGHTAHLRDRVAEMVLFAPSGEVPQWTALRKFRPAAAAIRWMRRTPLDAINAASHRYMATKLCQLAAHAKPGRAQLVPSAQPVDPRATADICTDATRAKFDPATAHALASTPVTLVTAEFDKVVPRAQTEHLHQRLLNASRHHVPAAGHSLPLATPHLAAPIVVAAARRAADPAQPQPDTETATVVGGRR